VFQHLTNGHQQELEVNGDSCDILMRSRGISRRVGFDLSKERSKRKLMHPESKELSSFLFRPGGMSDVGRSLFWDAGEVGRETKNGHGRCAKNGKKPRMMILRSQLSRGCGPGWLYFAVIPQRTIDLIPRYPKV